MAFPNYYVGDLNNIGQQMSQDREIQARKAMAQAEQRRAAEAQIQQALMERARQQQQNQQFQQELGLRQADQQQRNAYQNLLLGLRQKEIESQGQINPQIQLDEDYRRAALAQRIKELELQNQTPDARVAAALATQAGQTARDTAQAQEAWESETAGARSKAAQYNALVESIDKDAEDAANKYDPWGWTTDTDKKRAGEEFRRAKYAELIQGLSLDKRPGDISPNPTTRRFEPVLRPRPGGNMTAPPIGMPQAVMPQQGGYISTDYSPRATRVGPSSANPALLNAIRSTTNTTSGGGYQSELAQLQAAAKSGAIDRAAYIAQRRALDEKYGVR